jgi:hypothetical protein
MNLRDKVPTEGAANDRHNVSLLWKLYCTVSGLLLVEVVLYCY